MNPRQRLLVIGMTGSGKTYYVDHEYVRLAPHVAVFSIVRNLAVSWHGNVATVPAGAKKWGLCPTDTAKKNVQAALKDFVDKVTRERVALVVVDEVLFLMEWGCEPFLVQLAIVARNMGVALILISQRAYPVPRSVRTQTSDLVSFQQCDDVDIRQIRIMTGNPNFPGVCKNPSVDDRGRPLPCAWPRSRGNCIKHFEVGEFLTARIRG